MKYRDKFADLRIYWRLVFGKVPRFSRLWLWVGNYIYFEFTPASFQWMFFNLVKEINRLIRKGMSNIYLKVTIEKNWRSQNFDFPSFENLSPGQLLGSSYSRTYYWILKIFLQLKNQRSGRKIVCCFSIILIFEGIVTF